MTYYGGNRRATVNPDHPDAFAICDRCGFLWNHSALAWQFQFRGNSLGNIRLLVCPDCLDVPHEFVRPVLIPADPKPVKDPRPSQATTQMGSTPADVTVRSLVAPDD